MRNINEYILEKLVIDKDVEVSHLEQTVTDDKILRNQSGSDICNILGYDYDILTNHIMEWIVTYRVEEFTLNITNECYMTMKEDGCPDMYLNKFIVNDKRIKKFHEHCEKPKILDSDGEDFTLKSTYSLPLIPGVPKEMLLFFNDDIVIAKYSEKYEKR